MKFVAKFAFAEDTCFVGVEEDVIFFLAGIDVQVVLEEFYLSHLFLDDDTREKLLDNVVRFLRKLEEKGETLYKAREALNAFINRKLERLAINSL